MKYQIKYLLTFLMMGFIGTVFAQNTTPSTNNTKVTPPAVHGPGFVDKNGDGFNDNAPDHDGDGIPNGVDPDYKKNSGKGPGFVDADGDGVNDNAKNRGKGKMGKGMRGGKGNCKNVPAKTTTAPKS